MHYKTSYEVLDSKIISLKSTGVVELTFNMFKENTFKGEVHVSNNKRTTIHFPTAYDKGSQK
jgi:hypothetical protein